MYSSYLPSIIAMSFCRGLSTSHMRGAGRALTEAEVWNWCPHWVRRTRPECRDEELWALIWKYTVRPLPQSNSGAPAECVVLWQLVWEDTLWCFFRASLASACLQVWQCRVSCAGSEQKRLFLNRLTQSNDIVPAANATLPVPASLLKLISQQVSLSWRRKRIPPEWLISVWNVCHKLVMFLSFYSTKLTFDSYRSELTLSALSCQCHCSQWRLALATITLVSFVQTAVHWNSSSVSKLSFYDKLTYRV